MSFGRGPQKQGQSADSGNLGKSKFFDTQISDSATGKIPFKIKSMDIFTFPEKHDAKLTPSFHIVDRVQKKKKEERESLAKKMAEPIIIVDREYEKIIAELDLKMSYQPTKNAPEQPKVTTLSRANSRNNIFYFFKHNPLNSPMSELEAFCWACYQLLIPNNVSKKSSAHYKENLTRSMSGVSSVAIPDFKSTMEDPLKEEDLNNDSIVEGLALALTASYIFEEDDLHRGNMSKTGMRIDFDMSLWPILYNFKEGQFIIDWVFRRPKENTFIVDEIDIKHFPNLKVATPFYHPSKVASSLSDIMPISKNSFGSKDIAIYSQLENNKHFKYYKFRTLLKFILTDASNYQSIASLFVRKEFKSPELGEVKINHMLTEHLKDRIQKIRDVLIQMIDFRDFLKVDGECAFKEIMYEFSSHNNDIDSKVQKLREKNKPDRVSTYEATKIDLEQISTKFHAIETLTKMSCPDVEFPIDLSMSMSMSSIKRYV